MIPLPLQPGYFSPNNGFSEHSIHKPGLYSSFESGNSKVQVKGVKISLKEMLEHKEVHAKYERREKVKRMKSVEDYK